MRLVLPSYSDLKSFRHLSPIAGIHTLSETPCSVLGIIANNWLIIADQSELGIEDPDCLTLAQLHSDAVDYPKSGQPVSIERIPKLKFLAKPDWSAPETVNVAHSSTHYKSRSAIGCLFRAVDLSAADIKRDATRRQKLVQREHNFLDAAFGSVHAAVRARVSDFIDVERPLSKAGRDSVTRVYKRYVSELKSICVALTLSHRREAMLTEEEAFIGTIAEKTSTPKKRKEKVALLRERTQHLVKTVRDDLAMGETNEKVVLGRVWVAWKLAMDEDTAFGAKSFGWVALGVMFEMIKGLQDATWAKRY
ncbi:RNA dependent RNA polymerase-domain-containing protein [Amylostereum chailletii]|nr:RNA dependent RNA polymerase-domain-containing protein [Amylostereum chailletii]